MFVNSGEPRRRLHADFSLLGGLLKELFLHLKKKNQGEINWCFLDGAGGGGRVSAETCAAGGRARRSPALRCPGLPARALRLAAREPQLGEAGFRALGQGSEGTPAPAPCGRPEPRGPRATLREEPGPGDVEGLWDFSHFCGSHSIPCALRSAARRRSGPPRLAPLRPVATWRGPRAAGLVCSARACVAHALGSRHSVPALRDQLRVPVPHPTSASLPRPGPAIRRERSRARAGVAAALLGRRGGAGQGRPGGVGSPAGRGREPAAGRRRSQSWNLQAGVSARCGACVV